MKLKRDIEEVLERSLSESCTSDEAVAIMAAIQLGIESMKFESQVMSAILHSSMYKWAVNALTEEE